VADSTAPWVTVPLRHPSPGYNSTWPEAIATLHFRAARFARRDNLPAGTRLRVTITRTLSGSVWLDGEPLLPIPGVNDWGPPPAGAPCTCTLGVHDHHGRPRIHVARDLCCPQHGESPDPEPCTCDAHGMAYSCPQHGLL